MFNQSRKRIITALGLAAAATLYAAVAEARSFAAMGKNMRVSASFQTVIPLAGPADVQAEAKATEDARRALYEIASRECAVITKVFKSTCHITNLNVRSYVRNRGNGIRQISINANANYLVVPQRDENREDDRKL